MDHLGIERAVVGGMSQGGFLSLRAALLAPERVSALILLDTSATPEDPEVLEQYRAMADTWLTAGPVDELAAIVADIIIADPDENPKWIAKWQARPKELMREPSACLFGREDITDRLAEITCPAIVVHGTDDTSIPMEDAEALADGLPGAGPVVKVGGRPRRQPDQPGPGQRGPADRSSPTSRRDPGPAGRGARRGRRPATTWPPSSPAHWHWPTTTSSS